MNPWKIGSRGSLSASSSSGQRTPSCNSCWCGTVTVFVDMERNPVLSYIGGSDPGRITWDSKFLGHVFIYGALPLLTLLATQVPAIGDVMLNWMEPILRSAK